MTASDERFEGFPADAFVFFRDLAVNNNKEWFEANRARYQQSILSPASRFIAEFGQAAQLIEPALQFDPATNGRGSMFRIYRDVRFAKDKRPYKTNLGLLFWMGGFPKKKDNPGLYFHLDADGARLHGGLYGFQPSHLDAFRQAVQVGQKADELSAILETLRAAGWEVKGSRYSRLPRGLVSEYPASRDLAYYKSLYATGPSFARDDIAAPDLVSTAFERAKTAMPLVRWLAQNLQPLDDPRARKDH